MQIIEIIPRYCCAQDSGSSGYVAGILARNFDGPTKVRLKTPPPLQSSLEIQTLSGRTELFSQKQLIATAELTEMESPPLPPPTVIDASQARQDFLSGTTHPQPDCFVCGINRKPGDGLNIFTGQTLNTRGDAIVASDWRPSRDLLDVLGFVQPEFIWAALDCPGYFGLNLEPERLCFLSEISAVILKDVPGDQLLMVYGWKRGHEDRQFYAGSAIADAEGTIYAHSEQTWVVLE